MDTLTSSPLISDLPDIAAGILSRVRGKSPRVHCLTNAVAQNFTANVLLAAGAVPSMTVAPDEIAQFVARANALLINLGTLDGERRQAATTAIEAATTEQRPWVLDPVFIDRSRQRAEFAGRMMAMRPQVVRLNGVEFAAIAQAEPEQNALDRYARDQCCVVALTGATDAVTDGGRRLKIENGAALMGQVTAMGCAGTALVAACLAVEKDSWLAASAALLAFAVAGECAAARARGPGSMAVEILDALAGLDREIPPHARARAMNPIDLRLYALIDPEHAGPHDIVELAGFLAEGGATCVQLRDKRGATRPMVDRARRIKSVLEPFKVPLLINDRVDVALASGADGVHVGQDDMAVDDARRLLGNAAIIGLSIRTAAQAAAAPLGILDYVGVGGVFATSSKETSTPPIGVAGLSGIADIVRGRAPQFPLCGIAGITAENAQRVIAAGADGVAVISALSLAADPRCAARRMRAVVDAALGQRNGR